MRDSLLTLGPFAAGVAAILATLAPFGVGPGAWPSPHLLLAVLAFWAIRRETLTPPLLVFALGLALDLTRAGPVGAELFALLAVVEALRLQSERLPVFGLPAEMARVAAAVVAFEAATALLLTLAVAERPDLAAAATRAGLTIAVYPALAALQQAVFGVRRGEGGFLAAAGLGGWDARR